MKINGTNGASISASAIGMDAGIGGQTDPMVKDLQRQIEDLKNQMKELSSNSEMSPEMKSKKRQDLQKQISDLEVQLRQRQMEVKREEAMEKRQKNYSMDEMLGTKQQTGKSDKQSTGLSTGNMEAMISADASVKQADVHGSIAKKMEGRAGVLEAEIKQDSAMGCAPEGKEEALAKAEAKANEAISAQMSALAQANKAVKEAAEADQSKNTTQTGENQQKSVFGAKQTDKAEDDTASNKSMESGQPEEDSGGNTFDTEQLGVPFSRGYQPVDVKL